MSFAEQDPRPNNDNDNPSFSFSQPPHPTSNNNINHDSLPPQQLLTRKKVAIVGAGAAGLQCAHSLVQQGWHVDDLILLEARNRVGGRIHTTRETILRMNRADNDNCDKSTCTTKTESTAVTVYRDHGAAWVHGTGFAWPVYMYPPDTQSTTATRRDDSLLIVDDDDDDDDDDHPCDRQENPMMALLQQVTPSDQHVCLTHLDPIFEAGNPWMRPGHVLLSSNNLAVLVHSKDGCHYQFGGNDNNDDSVLWQALKHHQTIMTKIGQLAQNLIRQGKRLESTQTSFQTALEQVVAQLDDDDAPSNNDESTPMISLVAGFYRHLIECWHATSASKLQWGEFSVVNDNNNNNNNNDDAPLTITTDLEYSNEGDFVGPHCTLKTGMQTILQPLLETTRSCIQLNQPVTRIRCQTTKCQEQSSSTSSSSEDNNQTPTRPIRLETSTGTIVEAEYCVVTIPLGCLAQSILPDNATDNSLRFEPPLSPAKITAIQHMDMGCYKKVFLTFDRIFWPAQEAFVGLIRPCQRRQDQDEEGLGQYLLLDNLWARHDIPAIEAILIGTAGQWATGQSTDCIRRAVLQFLADATGLDLESQLQQWCVDCHVTRWEEDPYARGAYSGYKLGTLEEHTQGLASPEWNGRLVFAGEATLCGDEGSVHAALESGTIAAQHIITNSGQV